jgi:hypothetical protein|nr:MAG TPA: hypothetical protein [Caudoviricetes sp.]
MANLVTFAKKLWKDKVGGNTPITAAELNRMENGINNCATQINKLGDSVCRLGTDNGTTECSVSLSGNDLIIMAKNKFGKCVSLNCYEGEIVVYDEVLKKRIGTYVKTK